MSQSTTPYFGKAIIFSAPSGAGKTTIVRHLLEKYTCFGFSVSACTRIKRTGEIHGKDYYFLTPEEFKQHIQQDAFAEWEEVYEGLYYGTLKSEIERLWSEGKHVLFDVDVRGGLQLKKFFEEKALAVFITVPSIDTLAERLIQRKSDPPESIQKRMAKFKEELQYQNSFDTVINNQELPQTLKEVEQLVENFVSLNH